MLLSAIDLISEKGYKGVTTQEIAAAAGVSEKTLFRHFGSKRKLIDEAFERFHYTGEMANLFQEQITWDLHADLLLIARKYHETMNRNRKMILISIKDEAHLPGIRQQTQQHPLRLMEFLTQYFVAMAEKGKMARTNPEIQALSFLMMHFGAFLNELEKDENFPGVTLDAFIEESVRIFAKALAP
ncbi:MULTISPECIES: TetR/AcrR family transcriptional regulator [Paenibacillus]|nr:MULTISPECIES: TetR/AcrR family transcriptional regulator [Paenibacillus]MDR9856280.1 TetR/AcrR family transcriptional regulator [Paenibacillus sp. VCA1]